MTELSPITPPPELVKQWVSLACEYEGNETWIDLATQAARWGADQELEACCEWLAKRSPGAALLAIEMREARRPKPPSLKKQALEELSLISISPESGVRVSALDTIRRALEQLDD